MAAASLTKLLGGKAPVLSEIKAKYAIRQALDKTAKKATAQFQKTVATWETKVEFTTQAPDPYSRIVGTDNEIYNYVNNGTRPHVIQAAPGGSLAFATIYSPKSAVNVIGSRAGGASGPTAFAQEVNHPGSEARDFDVAIAADVQKTIGQTFNEELGRALSK